MFYLLLGGAIVAVLGELYDKVCQEDTSPKTKGVSKDELEKR